MLTKIPVLLEESLPMTVHEPISPPFAAKIMVFENSSILTETTVLFALFSKIKNCMKEQ